MSSTLSPITKTINTANNKVVDNSGAISGVGDDGRKIENLSKTKIT